MYTITHFYFSLFFTLALFGCNSSPKNFGQVYVDPVADSYRKNRIKSFKIYTSRDDTLSHFQSIKLDSFGQVIWQATAPEFKNEILETYIYDSLGRVIIVVGAEEKKVKYEEDGDNGILKEIWTNAGDVSLVRLLKFSPDLKRIQKEIEYGASRDTVTYEHQYKNDQIQQTLKNGNILIEYEYDELNRLKAVKSFGISGYIIVDYVSPRTGLVDSTIFWDDSYQKTQVSPHYYKYLQ